VPWSTLSNSTQPDLSVTLFLDATHQSKITAKLLRDLGVKVEVHKRYFLPNEPDPNWIANTSARGWAIISGDKGLEYDGINRQAVREAKAKVFILADTTSRTIEWASSLVLARHKILSIAADNNGPFYCQIEKGKDDHVGKPQFLDDGGPIPKPEGVSESQMAVPDKQAAVTELKPKMPKNRNLFDDQ
jgi:hypothetical protein